MNYQMSRPASPPARSVRKRRGIKFGLGILISVLLCAGLVYGFSNHVQVKPKGSTHPSKVTPIATKKLLPLATPVVKPPTVVADACAANTLDQNIVVSISQRHLWACDGASSAYDSAVVTGMENLAADLTPVGTYHIYAKETNLSLKGSDSTGSWDDPVSYWMPWLDNQYGQYGFHDATWRAASDFGNIDPYSANASHGCVELPLATAKWIYDWASIGTTVTIES